MSDQEMLFADPDWQPPGQGSRSRQQAAAQPSPVARPVNDAPAQPRQHDLAWTASQPLQGEGDSADAAYAPYEEGYRDRLRDDDDAVQAQQQTGARSARRSGPQAQRGGIPWLWITLALVVLIIIGFSPIGDDALLAIPRVFLLMIALGAVVTFLAFLIQASPRKTSRDITETHTFIVAAQPKIIVKDDLGSIRVHPGSDDHQVIVQVTKHSYSLLGHPASATVQYEQNNEKNRVTIRAGTGWHFLGKSSVDVDITVPRLSDLELKNEAGSISVSGVNGQMTCATDAGSVKVTQAMLRGDSRLKTDAGAITFSGTLHPHGSYTMTTDAGSVNVTLPAASSFRVDAKTDVGSINSDFPLAIQRDFPGAKARGDIGPAPCPMLKLRTDVGTINVRQG
jgi:Toastrack DUF4097